MKYFNKIMSSTAMEIMMAGYAVLIMVALITK